MGRRTYQRDFDSRIIPIRLREDLTVRIQDIPYDLTEQEAEKLVNVIKALAVKSEAL